MSNINGLTPVQQVKLNLVMDCGFNIQKAEEASKFVFREGVFADNNDEPFKVLPENYQFMSLVTVDGGIELNLKMSDISGFFSEDDNIKIITDGMEITARGTVTQFKAFMKSHVDEWGGF